MLKVPGAFSFLLIFFNGALNPLSADSLSAVTPLIAGHHSRQVGKDICTARDPLL